MFVLDTSLLLSTVWWLGTKKSAFQRCTRTRQGPQLQQGALWLYTWEKKSRIGITKSLAREAMKPPALIETGLAKLKHPHLPFQLHLFCPWVEVDNFQRYFPAWIILFVYFKWNFSNGTSRMWGIIAVHYQG